MARRCYRFTVLQLIVLVSVLSLFFAVAVWRRNSTRRLENAIRVREAAQSNLAVAVTSGNVALAREAFDAGADTNSVLRVCLEKGSVAMLELLLKAGADVQRNMDAIPNSLVHRIIARLQIEGLLTTAPYKPIQLTAKGRRLATRSRQRHEIVYRFLLAIGVDPATAAQDAEGIEHHVSPKTLQKFQEAIERSI